MVAETEVAVAVAAEAEVVEEAEAHLVHAIRMEGILMLNAD